MNISKIVLTLSTISLLGFGCASTQPSGPETALTRCDKKPYTTEFAKIFGDAKNYAATENSPYGDEFRTADNTCVYMGFVPSNNKNYFFAVSVIPDKDKKFFTWNHDYTESAGTEIITATDPQLPTESFYRKVTILDQINFGEIRKQKTGWDLVVHSGDTTYAISDVPQFSDMTEEQVKAIMGAVYQRLSQS